MIRAEPTKLTEYKQTTCDMPDRIVHYDTASDILSYRTIIPNDAYGDEDDKGIVVFRNTETDEVIGCTIFDFVKRCNEGTLELGSLPCWLMGDLAALQSKVLY